MSRWNVVTVLGRPSANTSDFFNSIKFDTVLVEAKSMKEALDLGAPDRRGISGEALNWYAFPVVESETQQVVAGSEEDDGA